MGETRKDLFGKSHTATAEQIVDYGRALTSPNFSAVPLLPDARLVFWGMSGCLYTDYTKMNEDDFPSDLRPAWFGAVGTPSSKPTLH